MHRWLNAGYAQAPSVCVGQVVINRVRFCTVPMPQVCTSALPALPQSWLSSFRWSDRAEIKAL